MMVKTQQYSFTSLDSSKGNGRRLYTYDDVMYLIKSATKTILVYIKTYVCNNKLHYGTVHAISLLQK